MVKRKKMGMSLILGSTMMVAGPVLAGCSTGVSADDWAATEGAIGRINMDAVQEAFEKSQSVEEFENRLNEIYEGDGIVLIRAKEEGGKRIIEAFEDLDKNSDLDPGKDDLLFTITNENDTNELRGHGSNRHHSAFGGGGNFLFTYLIFSSISRGGYGYYTPRSRVPQMETIGLTIVIRQIIRAGLVAGRSEKTPSITTNRAQPTEAPTPAPAAN